MCDYKYLWFDCFKLVVGSNLEKTIQQIMDMGGGSWDRDTGIPEVVEIFMSIGPYPINQTTKIGGATARAVFGVHNSSPLNMFPKEIICGVGAGIGLLDFLRNNLQPVLLELGKQNLSLLRLISEHHVEFL
ncbi:hypothetical protein JHK87_040371 [Glycine soja]|nr:hypothetical protein JHK87_040371 [Glycine soja]